MARGRKATRIVKREHRQGPEPNPTLTRDEWDEVMRWRMARMIEAGKRIPTLEELQTAIKKAVQKARGAA